MNVICSICLELMITSDDISSVNCGHLFHTICINQWLETSQSCSICRSKCRRDQLRRIFFTEAENKTLSQSDFGKLQHKIDSLTFENRCLTTEKKKILEERDGLTAKNISLVEDFRNLEKNLQESKEKFRNIKSKLKMTELEISKLKKVKEEGEEAKAKLKMFSHIDQVIKADKAEAMKKLHELGDFSSTCQTLAYEIICLKNELSIAETQRERFQEESKIKRKANYDLEARLSLQSKDLEKLYKENQQIRDDLRYTEEENKCLLAKLECLKKQSQKCETKLNGHNDFIDVEKSSGSESNEEKPSVDLENKPVSSPIVRPVSNSLVGYKRSSSDVFKEKTNVIQFGKRFRCEPGKYGNYVADPSSKEEYHFNGLGGHSKNDIFPSGLKKNSSKKTTTSRSLKKSTSASIDNKIDKFFKFD